MSALAGLWRFDGRTDAEDACARILAGQQVYGPHDRALAGAAGGALALGRNLFRRQPEDAYDRQPLTGARWRLVADVRLDNRDELAGALGLASHAPTLSDADILLVALERWGPGCCERLLGDFAFAAWDGGGARLVLARDAIGMRPLHYHQARGFFAFASMPKGLHALDEIPRAPDEDYIARGMIHAMSQGSGSFFEDIRRVEPGAIVTVTPAGVRAAPWWSPPRETLRLKRQADYVEAARAELDAAVARSLRGANRVAAHLSAGLDSSAVASTAARLLASSGGAVIAYTAVPRDGYDLPLPPGAIGDEGPLAARTAALHANIEHVLVRGAGRSPLVELDRIFFLYEQPLASLANAVWTHAIYDDARAKGVDVLLTGALGNLTLGYDGLASLPDLLGQGRLLRLAREWTALRRSGRLDHRAAAIATFGPHAPRWLWRWARRRLGRGDAVPATSALRPDRFEALQAQVRAAYPESDGRPWRDSVELRLWGLRRVDRGAHNKAALAGWGLDVRDPTADRRLVEFCLSLPPEQFLRGGVPRALARAVLADRVPHEVLCEPRRGRQAVDWHEGVTADLPGLAQEIERLGACGPAARVLDIGRLRALAQTWPSGGWERPAAGAGYRIALLRGLSIGHFIRKAAGANA
jgi:asparagine synthase (glutamine-hydrolysing)